MRKTLTEAAKGAGDFFAGSRIIVNTPKLWPFVWIPVLINVVVYVAVFGTGIYFFNDWVEFFIPSGEVWYMEMLQKLAWVVFTITLLLVMFLTFFSLVNLIASPFNEMLSAKYEELKTGRRVEGNTNFLTIIRQELKRILLYIIALVVLGIITSLISFIPVINLIIPVLWAFFAGVVLSFEFLSYALDRRNSGFEEKLGYIRKHLARCEGFGITVSLALLVPLLNITVIPCAVIGATHMFINTEDVNSYPVTLD